MKKLRKTALVVFTCYILFLCYFLFFADSMGRTLAHRTYQYNFIPFKEIIRFWRYRELLKAPAVCLNLLGNIVAFIPFGCLVPGLFQRCRRPLCAIACSFLFSFMVEMIQLIAKIGICDVDDMILNTVGGTIGVLLYLLTHWIWRRKHEKKK